MADPTAFISPENLLPGSESVPGWSSDPATGTVLLSATNALDYKADTLTRFEAPSEDATVYFDASFGHVGFGQLVGIVNHNLHGLSLTVRLYDVIGFNGDYDADPNDAFALTIPPLPAHLGDAVGPTTSDGLQHVAILVLPAAAQYAAIRLEMEVAGTSRVLDFGELWVGKLFTPEKGIVFETEFGVIDPSEQAWSAGNQGYVSARTPSREITLSFPAITEAEAFGRASSAATEDNIFSIMGRVGKRKPILCGPLGVSNADSRAWLMHRLATYGFITSDFRPRVKGRTSTRVYGADLTVRETR